MPQEPDLGKQNDIVEFADKKETDFSSFFVWFAFALAIGFVAFIYLSDYSLKNQIDKKQSEKDQAIATLNLPDNKKVVDDVNGLKEVISILTDSTQNQKSKKAVLDDLYKYITKDVHISTLSVANDGTVGLDGTTATYRTAADFMVGLKSYSKVSNFELKNISMSTDTEADQAQKVTFSVSFKLDMAKDQSVAATSQTADDSASLGITSAESDTESTAATTDAASESATPSVGSAVMP